MILHTSIVLEALYVAVEIDSCPLELLALGEVVGEWLDIFDCSVPHGVLDSSE